MVDRVESNSKFASFKGIFSFYTLLHFLNTCPVFVFKHSIIVWQECRALESGQLTVNNWLSSIPPVVKVEMNLFCTCIISILNNFLKKGHNAIITSKLKILWIKKMEIRDGNKSTETRNLIEFGIQSSRTEQAAEIKMTLALYRCTIIAMPFSACSYQFCFIVQR